MIGDLLRDSRTNGGMHLFGGDWNFIAADEDQFTTGDAATGPSDRAISDAFDDMSGVPTILHEKEEGGEKLHWIQSTG
eukprot:2071213-Heterocapsa_arctica.AAC.1